MTSTDLEIIAARLAELISVNPRWMKLKQAARYGSIGEKELVNLIRSKKIKGFQDLSLKTKPWIVEKTSIDKYRSQQMFEQFSALEKFGVDIVNSLD